LKEIKQKLLLTGKNSDRKSQRESFSGNGCCACADEWN